MLYKIEGFVNCSNWGKLGKDSYIYKFLHTDQYLNSPLAELWFGTHPNGMSKIDVEGTSISLGSYLSSVGVVSGLPYLAKILSVNAPLSIQLHPPKDIAERLHLENPQNYPDDKAKHEMSIALTEVRLLCGVREFSAIREHLGQIAAFTQLGEQFHALLSKGNLRDLSRHIFNLRKSELDQFAKQILLNEQTEGLYDEWSKVVLDLLKSGASMDPGMVFLYLLEYLIVPPGEAIFIEPGVPHAYISGDMFECMQASDNVVRGGLTSKYIDSSTFIELFREMPYESKLVPISSEDEVREFRPLDCSFVVTHLHSNSPIVIDLPAQSIVINLAGSGKIKSTNSIEDLTGTTAYYSPHAYPSLELIPDLTLDTFIISPS